MDCDPILRTRALRSVCGTRQPPADQRPRRFARVFVLALVVLLASAGTAQARDLPQMRGNVAEAYMDYALGKRFGDSYTQAADTKLSCHHRRSRVRMGCRIGWAIGDSYYYGKGSIWYSFGRHGNVLWNYGWRITELNDYCLQVERLPESQCTTQHVVH